MQEQGFPEEGVWDFKDIKQGSVAKTTFKFKNDSDKPVHIKDMITSCGCTASKWRKTVLPGEEISIAVEFKSKGYSGKVQQFVYVNTDRLDKPIVRYIIKANVVQ